jgi:hypothetical protein
VTRQGNLVRSTQWAGLRAGDVVVVDGAKERRQHWVFVAHVLNEVTSEEWVDVRGGRVGEAKGRSFRPELIYPSGANYRSPSPRNCQFSRHRSCFILIRLDGREFSQRT